MYKEKLCQENTWEKGCPHKYNDLGECVYCNKTKKQNRLRSLSEILIEADGSKVPGKIVSLLHELIDNKYQYPLVEVEFGVEHLKDRLERLKDDIIIGFL